MIRPATPDSRNSRPFTRFRNPPISDLVQPKLFYVTNNPKPNAIPSTHLSSPVTKSHSGLLRLLTKILHNSSTVESRVKIERLRLFIGLGTDRFAN